MGDICVQSKVQVIRNLSQHVDHIRSQLPDEVNDENNFEPKRLMMVSCKT